MCKLKFFNISHLMIISSSFVKSFDYTYHHYEFLIYLSNKRILNVYKRIYNLGKILINKIYKTNE